MFSNKFIFCGFVISAILVVILLATLSPLPHSKTPSKSWLALSLYIQQPQTTVVPPDAHTVAPQDAGALIFHRVLTEGPKNTSRVVGKAQGFIIPVEQFAHSGFNIIYLTFDTREYSGSVSIQARNSGSDRKDELTVVGGTGSFAFVRGKAFLTQKDDTNIVVPYHISLHLKYPDRSETIPG
ncbi:dirigent protein 17 [Cynara cardunculus var. scolymus]|uniref:Dirigent protein n=1 Tax=Cynara cardunculus var. scolymus TaxID=59895 RepID=A0A103XWU2_CYNCS|nr:dirigent protein 17 [Cynara cardunculus var. scolymus]KVH98378.1 Plant disease resistance response protein [Cynara cardunculus var. scolymus]